MKSIEEKVYETIDFVLLVGYLEQKGIINTEEFNEFKKANTETYAKVLTEIYYDKACKKALEECKIEIEVPDLKVEE